ncbi:MAG: hypothetical protein A3F70_00530 [Acidobacteria bacterium RIFCSPLOWO2_12_FULL_67_14]|nr:MAG: hypothetical protein A3H29_12950 [Acidobacteria bacterium RIFCSPLOWO2_02_FULL_67_21]OFW38754.1 MAG: hypothetical protein A3F70_00530 [Acidobacteria bacterium RIFCSPLOWO2_12_FULL_67_14]
MTARFYTPDAHRVGDLVDLPPDEAAHLARVLRLTAGSAVRLFNGVGGEFEGVVDAVSKGRAAVRLTGAREPVAEPRVAVTLAQAVLKGDKMDDVVRDAVMMGVAAVQPVVTARSEVTLAALRRGGRRERWHRIAVSAAKQSGRATVPPILEPCAFSDLTTALAQMALPGPAAMFVEPSADEGTLALSDLSDPPPRETTVIVGPEGGWDAEELARGAAVCRMVTLGRRTLRADAMAIVALAALFAIWKEY